MICDERHRFAVNVQVEVFTPPSDGESLTFGLAVELHYRSERPACICNHMLTASSGVCLGKDGKSDWTSINANFGVLIAVKVGRHCSLYKGCLELRKSVFILLSPFPRAVSSGRLA